MEYEIVIGLEIHAQLLTNTKLFCNCRSRFGDAPNTNGCPVCLGLPGSLPVLNRRAVEMAVRMGLAVGCSINNRSIFARKNYFYPDLPKGYQISQYDMPVCGKGEIVIDVDGVKKTIGITRIHIEEDAGKLIHDQDVDSLFDVNRCGTPLIEIVSEPDMRSPREAYEYFAAVKQILEYLQICDCNLEEGSMRCDANISLRPKGEAKLGTKTEIKNMNTLRGLEKALEYEAQRQEEVLRSGGKIIQQTYLWDPSTNTSIPMRSKEDAHDYRYFPEPDLMPLIVEDQFIESMKKTLPELPAARRARFEQNYAIASNASEVLTSQRAIADYFEETVKVYNDARQVANWIMTDVLRIVNDQKISISEIRITPQRLASLLKLVEDGTVSAKAARKVIDLMQTEDKEASQIIDEQGLRQVSDTGALESAIKKVLDDNPAEVQRYREGNKKLISFFVGQAMKATKGAGNPKEINSILSKLLG
ncbi:MAG TPA: Asp-tRNA(Asn)/Glu-tRNA(Gln) amidotransferase subunit GatB [Chitinispirillaceae bacterium]|nr:Asp-tRNA(Asn)/Glu-tRNA(Gln) amidotransferase subunit GatB [Chitinispirillaceae bacterium]